MEGHERGCCLIRYCQAWQRSYLLETVRSDINRNIT
jgi:hypothetical protein